MEKWAKSMNQRKELSKGAAPSAEAPEPKSRKEEADASGGDKGSLTEVLHVANLLQRNKQLAERRSAQAAEALVAAYGTDSDSDGEKKPPPSAESLIDWVKLACLLCKRQFKDKEQLSKHQQVSDLHKQNLEAWRMQNTPANYRDRAKERRQKFGPDTEALPKHHQHQHQQHQYHKVCCHPA